MADKLYVDIDKAVGFGYLSDWYQNSIDDTISPIWTDEHLMELVNDFLVIPNDTPTADVKEVKRGHWKVNEYPKQGKKFITCPACDSVIDCNYTKIDENEFDFCPYCGADMRGDTDG